MSDNVDAALTRRYGPLSGAQWAAVIAVGAVGGVWYYRRQQAAAVAATSSDGTSVDGGPMIETGPAGYGSTGGAIDTSGLDGGVSGDTGAGSSSGDGAIDVPDSPTNDSWLAKAVAALSAGGTAPVAAQSALGAYLSGAELTQAQADIVNAALRALGLPPEGAPPPLIAPARPPVTRRPTKPVVSHPGQPGDTHAHTQRNGEWGYLDSKGAFHPYADHPAGTGWSLTKPSGVYETFFDRHGRTWYKRTG